MTDDPHLYRAYRVGPGGRVSKAAIILVAFDDAAAIAQAAQLWDGGGIEVWDRAPRVMALHPKDEAGAD